MENKKTPKPGTSGYETDQPQDLTKPDFNSSTDHRASEELPATENLNDQPVSPAHPHQEIDTPKPNLGNENRKNDDDEKEREKIITP